MYNYLKKALLLISLLALPSINMVVKAMEDENQHTNICRAMVVWKDTNEILNPHQAMVVLKDEERSNGAQPTISLTKSKAAYWLSAVKRGVENTTVYGLCYGVVKFGNDHPWLTSYLTYEGVKLAVAACKCICWPDPNSPPDPLYLGDKDPISCQNECWGYGYFKNFTCPSNKRSDLW